MILESERLIIRRFADSDWKDMYEYLSQDSVVKYEPYGIFTEEECKQEAQRRSGLDTFWAVCLKENNKLIDIDTTNPKELMKIVGLFEEDIIISSNRTPNGHHIVVKNHDTRYLDKYDFVEVKKDAYFLLEVY